jgi:hypothetical protein
MKIEKVLISDDNDTDDHDNLRRVRNIFSRAFNFMPEYDGSLLGPLTTPGQLIRRDHLTRAINAASFAITEIMERQGRGVMPNDLRDEILNELAECRTFLKGLREFLERDK